jgi:hypothetical protein
MIWSHVRDYLGQLDAHPNGRLEVTTAGKIKYGKIESSGSKKSRVIFYGLEQNCYKIAATARKWFAPRGDYQDSQILVNGNLKKIKINVKSVMKRFDLPRDIVMANLKNLGTLVRLIQEKRLLQSFEDDKSAFYEFGHRFGTLIPLEEIAQKAAEKNRCYRLARSVYGIANSIDIHPSGLIAFDTQKPGLSITLDGNLIVRKVTEINPSLFSEKEFEKLAENSISCGVYESARGVCKCVSFHNYHM